MLSSIVKDQCIITDNIANTIYTTMIVVGSSARFNVCHLCCWTKDFHQDVRVGIHLTALLQNKVVNTNTALALSSLLDMTVVVVLPCSEELALHTRKSSLHFHLWVELSAIVKLNQRLDTFMRVPQVIVETVDILAPDGLPGTELAPVRNRVAPGNGSVGIRHAGWMLITSMLLT